MGNTWDALTYCNDEDLKVWLILEDQKIQFSEMDIYQLRVLRKSLSSMNDTLQIEYKNWIKSGDLSRAQLILEKQKINFNNYGEVNFPLPIDWRLGLPGKDNLNWQLHSMIFLRDLISAHAKTSQIEYFSWVKTFILDWSSQNISKTKLSPFAWNDHSTAYRLFALTNVFIYCLDTMPQELEFIKLLISLITRHQLILSDDTFYSRGTNHGLDQSFFLYLSSIVLDFTNYSSSIREVSLKRLRFEVENSFAKDGVHIENSPEYHDIVFYNVLRINKVIKEIELINTIDNFESFCKNALRYLTQILRPDGCWPPIGDSTVRSPRYIYDNLVHLSNYEEYSFAISQGRKGKPISDQYAIFPDSGYFIMRSNPTYLPFDKSIHIVFKCGFLSHYHRHDDDNNVLIFGYGEEWLTEGGLYQHSATDPQRIHMRSHYAHNLMAPTGVDAKRDRDKYPTSGIVDFLIDPPFARAKGETMMFPGFVYSREISYNGRNVIYIKDVLKKIENTNIT